MKTRCLRKNFNILIGFNCQLYMFANVRDSSLCHLFYNKEYLVGAYGSPINPIPGKEAWATVNKVILPMVEVRQAGRPKEKRYRSHLKKNKDKLCSRCHQK